VHPLGRSLPVTKSPKLLRPPPRVDHLAARGRATLACPPDGRNAPTAARPEASAPAGSGSVHRIDPRGFYAFLRELSESMGGSGSTRTATPVPAAAINHHALACLAQVRPRWRVPAGPTVTNTAGGRYSSLLAAPHPPRCDAVARAPRLFRWRPLPHDRKAHSGQARVELARVAVDLGDEGHPVVLVVAGPGDEALLERVAEAGDAVTGIAAAYISSGEQVGLPHRRVSLT